MNRHLHWLFVILILFCGCRVDPPNSYGLGGSADLNDIELNRTGSKPYEREKPATRSDSAPIVRDR